MPTGDTGNHRIRMQSSAICVFVAENSIDLATQRKVLLFLGVFVSLVFFFLGISLVLLSVFLVVLKFSLVFSRKDQGKEGQGKLAQV